MTNLRRSLAMFLAVIMMFSSFSFAGTAAEANECQYTVETYFMDTLGVYPSVPDETSVYTAQAGETVVLNAEEKEGFSFDSAESLVEFEAQADGSSVGRIFYSRNQYTATYIYEDLLGSQTEEALVYYGAEIPGFEANPSGKPAKQGYNFIMWSLDEVNKIEVPGVMPAYDIDMYPIYEIKSYTYTFDACDGGTFSNGERILTFEYEYGDVPEAPEAPAMPHMEFVDWDNNIPSTVTGSMTFVAMYNELKYAAIFMDGEDEVSYTDGYFYGDIIEELDIPEGYEAWTLSDGTYVEFPYTVTGNVVFYAAAAPSEYTARFYIDIEDTDPYEEFTVLQGEEIDFPADPEKTGYTFIGWNSDITVMPDEDVDFVAKWEVNEYTVYFDTNGGDEIAPIIVKYGDTISTDVYPVRDGYVFVAWEGMPEDGLMPAEDITVTAKWEKTVSEDYLSFRTEIYRQDETTGEWVVADKVERGETVKARIFIETGFAVGDGQVLCFFNNDVFTSEDINGESLVTNPSATSTPGMYRVTGSYATPSKAHDTFIDLVDYGYISEEFLENHTPITFLFRFSSFTCHPISGDEWFAEFELTAKEDAVGEGNFFVVPETIANSGDGYYAYISLTKGVEGESSLENVESMFDWNSSTNVESTPVSTGYGRIIYDADGGRFNSIDSDTLTVDAAVGESIDSENPEKVGYLFAGWEPQIPKRMTEEVITTRALWLPDTDTPFAVKAHYYDFSSGEGIYTEESFEFTGTTGNSIEIVEYMPENPDEYTEYILLSDFGFEFNELDNSADNILSDYVSADGTTVLELYFVPVSHIVIFDSNDGEFVDGEKVKYVEVPHGALATEYIPYAEAVKNGYVFVGWNGLTETTRIESDLTFTAAWDACYYNVTWCVDGYEYVSEMYKFDSTVIAPEPPEKEGFTFIGWFDENDVSFDSYDGKMHDYDFVFNAKFERNIYTISFDACDGVFESTGDSIMSIEAGYEETFFIPDEEPVKEGYTFNGWLDDKGVLCNKGDEIGPMPAYNMCFTALWEEIPPAAYEVVFDSNGSVEVPGRVAEAGETITLPSTQLDGYLFTGWLNNSDEMIYRAGDSFVMPEYDVIFTAVWEEIPVETTTEITTEPTTEPTTESTTKEDEPSTTEPVTEPSTTKPTTEPSTQPTTESTTKPVTEPTTKPTTVHTHTLKTVVVNATCEKEGKKYSVCNDCGQTVGNTTVIPALGHSAGAWQIVLEPTYETEGKKVKKCTRNSCGKVLEEAVIPVLEPETVEFSIKTPSRTTIAYGDSIYLHVVVELPAGAEVVWEASNSNFTYSTSADGMTCLISPASSGETTFTAKVVDEKNNVISETDTQVMTSNAGFFQKIIAFFKKLFGLTKVYPNAVNTVYDK